MKDPNIQAFDIKNPFVKRDEHGYRPSLLTIWHHDPSNHDSNVKCAWFIRSHHLDKGLVEKIEKDFSFEWQYWFDEIGMPKMSKQGVALEMYWKAIWAMLVIEYPHQHNKRRRIANRFFRKHLHEIMSFAENPHDSLFLFIPWQSLYEKKDYWVAHFSGIVAADVARKRRPWYKHPRWHINHWKIQFHPIQNLKRRYWDKCCVCGKRGSKTSFMSDWDGTKRWHSECDTSRKNPVSSNVG